MLIDTHVHLYPAFDTARFFAATVQNLTDAARSRGLPEGPGGIFLTETVREEAFAGLAAGQGLPPGWQVSVPEADPHALWLTGPGQERLLVVAGRQLISAEGLEVLAIGTRDTAPDGLPVSEILSALAASGRPAILPWGAGKWMGARGKVIAALAREAAPGGWLWGDNAGRPRGWPDPAVFKTRPVLPGTDPLPLAAAEAEAGRYGIVLEGALDPARPAEDICARLIALTAQPPMFGTRTGPLGFVTRQVQLRMGQ